MRYSQLDYLLIHVRRLLVTTLSLHCFHFSTINGLLSHTPIITLVDDLPPAEFLTLVLDILNSREVVLILLHGSDPGHVVEGHDLESEVLVILDLLDGFEE